MSVLTEMKNRMVKMNTNPGVPLQNTGRVSGDDSFGTARTDLATRSRDDFNRYMSTYAPIQDETLRLAQEDTSLIDAAPEDARRAMKVAEGITQRNIERYGADLTPAQRQELGREQQRTGQITSTSALNFARRDQMEQNLQRLGLVLNSGVNAKNQGLSMLSSSAQSEAGRQQGYNQSKAQARSTNIGALGTLATLAIFSDERLKDDITLVGKDGEYNIYKWEWNDIAKRLGITSKPVGVLAQEILLIKPEAVSVNRNGYYMVNYGEL